MPFDAGLTAAITKELKEKLVGAKIEKIQQPERDELIITVKNGRESGKLLISAKAGSARLSITKLEKENPQTPPMFCMLMRKHLSGGLISDITQLGFERAVEIKISTYNELGFPTQKYLILETTGRYSNIIFCDSDKKVVTALRLSELASDEKRKLLCGFKYEPLPLPENRISPLGVSKEVFLKRLSEHYENFGGEILCDKYLLSSYSGLSPLTAREITFRTTKNTSFSLSELVEKKLCENFYLHFSAIYSAVERGRFTPFVIKDREGKAIEFSFCEILQYETAASVSECESFSELLDSFYGERDLRDRIKQKAQDIFKLLSNAEARISKKAEMQREDIAKCAEKDKYKNFGDLITANMYMLKKGMTKVKVVDYCDENMPEVEIELEINLTPSQNAQKYYKKYNKMKSAEENLAVQLDISAAELQYIDTIFESLTKAQNEKDLEEIREELRSAGYGKRLESLTSKSHAKKLAKQKMKKQYLPLEFETSGGYKVLCGKNNLQNDYITTVLAEKNDYWFHVKNMPGSHVVMFCNGEEPDALDFTESAMIAAYYSSGKKIPNVAVDYTKVRNIKKPSGSKPGFVVYETNYSAYVTADEEKVKKLSLSK
ncbi:MAG: fibronectin/fibrinogen-binding protein [Ruminococcaceae bacterium]|nr:fibronectin/fibrinogen-binding protein [Oscillospiraceae bacterium]